MIKTALISVSDKSGLGELSTYLLDNNVTIFSTGNTYKKILKQNPGTKNVYQINDLTNFPEIMEGRVKTLHPKIYGGILGRRDNLDDLKTMQSQNIPPIDVVVANFYPFQETINKPDATLTMALDNIDIGGPCMIRASAKNYQDVVVLTSPFQYKEFIERMSQNNLTEEYKQQLATMAFDYVTNYDMVISNYFNQTQENPSVYRQYYPLQQLKYGLNPQQTGMLMSSMDTPPPFRPLNGKIGYINILDAINAWNLVYELKIQSPNCCYATSFKHTSPAGVSRSRPLTDMETKMYSVSEELSPVSQAFILARYCDPKSSFGDFVAVSDEVNEECAKLIKREVSDGIVAPSFTPEALEILKTKKNGNFIVLESSFKQTKLKNENTKYEIREFHGVTLFQSPNNVLGKEGILKDNLKTTNTDVTESQLEDLIMANTTLKYTQSNSVSFAFNNQCVVASGQQNRVDCTRLAGHKLENIVKRLHPDISQLYDYFKESVKRQEKINVIYSLLDDIIDDEEVFQEWLTNFTEEGVSWIKENIDKLHNIKWKSLVDNNVCLASDAFFPFEDNIDVAKKFNVSHIVQPGGSMRDDSVVERSNKYNMTMIMTGHRHFLH